MLILHRFDGIPYNPVDECSRKIILQEVLFRQTICKHIMQLSICMKIPLILRDYNNDYFRQ